MYVRPYSPHSFPCITSPYSRHPPPNPKHPNSIPMKPTPRNTERLLSQLHSAAARRDPQLMSWIGAHHDKMGVVDTIGFHLNHACTPKERLIFNSKDWYRDPRNEPPRWVTHKTLNVRIRFGKKGVSIQGEVPRLCGFPTNDNVNAISVSQLLSAIPTLLSFLPDTTNSAPMSAIKLTYSCAPLRTRG